MNRFMLAAGAAVLAFTAAPAYSQTSDFDGKWSVLIVTESGKCDAYRYPIVIKDGMVTYGGTNNFTVSGQVQSDGAVVVSVMQGQYGARGTGKLRGKSGSGKWAAPAGDCNGRWQAERR